MNKNNKAIPYGNNCLALNNGKLVVKERKQISVKARMFDNGTIKIDTNEDIKKEVKTVKK